MSTRKIILFSVLGLLVIFGGYTAYVMGTTRNHSPADTATYENGDFSMEVSYCRPYKKGRMIFGPESDGALQPWGQYWRAGANEATQFKLTHPVIFGGKELAAGEYVMYAVPGENSWTIGLNNEIGRWGYFEVDHEKDVLSVESTPKNLSDVAEQLTISFQQADSATVNLNLVWDQTEVAVPIQIAG
ncbi:MAG: DUF2911 domain-containing protein [Bacteroidota bacterium]